MKPKAVAFTIESINFLINEYQSIGSALSYHEDCTSMFYSDSENYRKIIKRMLGRLPSKLKIISIDRKIQKSEHSSRNIVNSITVVIKGLVAEYTIFYEKTEYGNIRINMNVDFIDVDDKEIPYTVNDSKTHNSLIQ